MPARKIFQFKIVLEDIKPPIWRRIQVPSTYSFWDLHVAIQDAMGWCDSHLHMFEVREASDTVRFEFGIPDEDDPGGALPSWEYKIKNYLSLEGITVTYEYDFGDSWRHDVILEAILPAERGRHYPVCLDGERRCPPEDCGGPWGYKNFLKAISDPSHEEHEDMMDWVGGSFNPEEFDPEEILFDDPEERLDSLYF